MPMPILNQVVGLVGQPEHAEHGWSHLVDPIGEEVVEDLLHPLLVQCALQS